MSIYGYARVSTRKQVGGNSFEEQQQLLEAEGCDSIVCEQHTGSTTVRPELDKLITKLSPGDKLVITKLDRFARNVVEGITLIKALFAKGVKVHILNIGLLEDTSLGRFFLQTLLAVAELERSMITERTQAGKEIAKTKPGFRDGRPPKFTEYQIQSALNLLEDHSYNQVEAMAGISKPTLIRAKRKAKANIR